MERRRIVLLATICLVAAVVVVAVWRGEREPEYQGRKLSEWLAMYADDEGRGPEWVERKGRAVEAIRRIGTNGLPWLMRWAFYEPSEWKTKSLSLLEKMPYGSGIKHRIYPGRPETLTQLSLGGFTILGKEATPVIPDAVRAMNALNSKGDWPMLILRCLGDHGLPSLMQVVTNRANTVAFRACALKYVSWDCTNSAWAVVPLTRCLEEEDWEIASGAAHALGQLAQEPNIAVPALMASLRHPNRSVRVNILYAMVRFKAATAIMEMLTDSDIHVREAATNLLYWNAPEPLPKEDAKDE